MIFAMELNFEDRWQSDHSLTKTASPKAPDLWKEQCSRRCHIRQHPKTPRLQQT